MQPTRSEFTTRDGLTLAAETYGDPANPPVVLAHGGGQTKYSWGGTASELAKQGWYAIAYDHRGHGESDWSDKADYTIEHFAGDLADIARALHRPPIVVGASLGGFSAMLALGEIDPALFAAIVLVDVTPSINPAGVSRVHAFMSEHIESGFGSLEEVAEAVAGYTGRPKRDDYSGLRKNLRERDGRFYWHWDPDFFKPREGDEFSQQRMRDAASRITVPVMLVRGKASDVVTEPEVQEFLQLIPHAEYVDIEKARHMVAGDRNDIFTEAVTAFLTPLHP